MINLSLINANPSVVKTGSSAQFQIKAIHGSTHDSSFGGYPWRIDVCVTIDVKAWNKIKKAQALGQLYGIDISNAVYAINQKIPAVHPSVDDSARAKAGVKTIRLTYFLRDPARAQALGFKLIAGQYSKFADHVSILSTDAA